MGHVKSQPALFTCDFLRGVTSHKQQKTNKMPSVKSQHKAVISLAEDVAASGFVLHREQFAVNDFFFLLFEWSARLRRRDRAGFFGLFINKLVIRRDHRTRLV